MGKSRIAGGGNAERETRSDYQALFQSPVGEKVLKSLKEFFGGHTLRFDVNRKADPYHTIYREGQRSVILFIEEMLEDIPKETKIPQGGSDDENGDI